jgi:hypothetical protein
LVFLAWCVYHAHPLWVNFEAFCSVFQAKFQKIDFIELPVLKTPQEKKTPKHACNSSWELGGFENLGVQVDPPFNHNQLHAFKKQFVNFCHLLELAIRPYLGKPEQELL